jgi:hypothetical protein
MTYMLSVTMESANLAPTFTVPHILLFVLSEKRLEETWFRKPVER